MSQDDVRTIRAAYEAFAKGDIPAVLSNFTPDIEWIEAEDTGLPFAGTHRGQDAVASEVFATVPENWDDFTVTPERFIDGSDAVVVISRFRGKGKGGTPLDVQSAQLFEMRDGKVARMQHFTDTAAWWRSVFAKP
ncbi:MAG TPA: nuclear transport factor 2 family protein [Acidimicrobiales bacterium]